jgi:hypothetical protein
MIQRYLTAALAAFFLLAAAPVRADDDPAARVVSDPTLAYRKAFRVEVPPEAWNRILDHPYLMTQLWAHYRFQPAYRVTRSGADLHVVDPSGITGDLRPLPPSDASRAFYGAGSFHHWAIPSFFSAEGVVSFECKPEGGGLTGEAKIFMRGSNGISRLAMRLFSALLLRHIDRRFTSNLNDTKKIIHDIVHDPDRVRKRLAGPLRDDFDRMVAPP